ncbi:MAG: DsrE/DsrF/DrsH-like family protein [Candidatus Heimdallarchaeaceae archaeon]|uniref:DsrE/DsrF/DrsH-like family protein n=1 Tax=Candidatus Heimdallarchaeum endolithica TaxID=2876572 RepID=A0A9Y1FPI1_9ARCH|nr:MAG: DsrE/DsrF/DrsH-like family protein [Candidatus Heimdallarchaeum endolithica]
MSEKKKKIAIIASKANLADAYPPFILASTAAAMDYEVSIFFTFFGLNLLKKKGLKKVKITPVGETAMPKPIPQIVGIIPGMTDIATTMMKNWMKKANVVSLEELRELSIEAGVKMIACQMTMDVMKVKKEELIDEIEVGGAATFLQFASEADITLYI